VRVYETSTGCANCGATRKSNRTGRRSLYLYRTETDGGRSFQHKGLFCCKSCHDAFHG
jgi:hypothetical protein